MRQKSILCFCLLLFPAALLAAETPLVPRGPAAQVNSAAGDGSSGAEAPVPALAPDGNLLVVWGTPRESGSAILVRRFDATGKPGP
ncbi:MAG TPA: hypothetical protein VH988_15080, partial [Thermoanaerobaculia bacterium]|nr:hypothetical protein [Thermoanaerobaculia bacterium]